MFSHLTSMSGRRTLTPPGLHSGSEYSRSGRARYLRSAARTVPHAPRHAAASGRHVRHPQSDLSVSATTRRRGAELREVGGGAIERTATRHAARSGLAGNSSVGVVGDRSSAGASNIVRSAQSGPRVCPRSCRARGRFRRVGRPRRCPGRAPAHRWGSLHPAAGCAGQRPARPVKIAARAAVPVTSSSCGARTARTRTGGPIPTRGRRSSPGPAQDRIRRNPVRTTAWSA